MTASTQITPAIARLRQLTQLDIQADWWMHHGELNEIPDELNNQSDWEAVTLNAKNHVAWDKGQKVVWLFQQVAIPNDLQDYSLTGLRLKLALTWWAEAATVYVQGEPVQSGDLFDCVTRIELSAAAQPGESFAIALRLVSPGHDDGALVKSQLIYEEPNGIDPGFVADELEVTHQYLTAFAPEILPQVETVVRGLDWGKVSDRPVFDQSLETLRQTLQTLEVQPGQSLSSWIKQRRIGLVGHAHLDLAWLWPVSETWEAAQRTFESALNLQKEFPELIFCHSTPALYEWIEQHRPDLFARIQAQVQAGRWEIVAGLWVEPELNLISGESLVRQVLYGQRYTLEKFGQLSAIAWLPDTFGFCWQLPQILKQGGVETFVTQKLRWNDTTRFPYDWFWWRSPDGSEILSLMSAPIGEGIDPVKMSTFACDWETRTQTRESLWLPGVGDHGGGPTREMLKTARRWERSPLFPQIEFTTVHNYIQTLQTQTPDLPVWDNELYLEFHRGCYTSHADQKQANRRCENLLYEAELWSAIATLTLGQPYPKTELETAWKQVLFNQFHDILPGSSIPQVFVDANETWMAAEKTATQLRDTAWNAIATHLNLGHPPHPDAQPFVVFNSLNWQRSEVISIRPPSSDHAWQIYDSDRNPVPTQPSSTGYLLFTATQILSIGYRVFWLTPILHPPSPIPHPPSPILDNGLLKITIDPETGDIASIWDYELNQEILSGPGNQLQAFKDEGQYWDAWNIDPHYAEHPLPPATLTGIHWLESGPLQSSIRVIRTLGQSEFHQDYILDTNSKILKIATTVDWQERHILVKAAFPLSFSADHATYEIPCGAIARPTAPTDPHDQAKWEVPALRWADLSTDEYGVSLLNDCKYGYDCQPNQIRLTLLRGSTWPDPECDRGTHTFTYALYIHPGTWQTAHSVRKGYELNLPLQPISIPLSGMPARAILPTPIPQSSLAASGQFLDLQSKNLILMTLKQSEDHPQQWIMRGYECHGQAAPLRFTNSLGLEIAHPTNLLEQPLSEVAPTPETLAIAPWQILSLLAKPNSQSQSQH